MAAELLKKYKLKAEQASGTEGDIDNLLAFSKELADAICGVAKTPAFLDEPKYRKETVKELLVQYGHGVVMCAFQKWVSS